MNDELSRLQNRLADWQRRNGTARVVVVSTLFSCIVSGVLSYALIFAFYGADGVINDTHNLVLTLPLLVPLAIAPMATLQLASALGTAATVIDELSATRTDLEDEVAARQLAQLELEQLASRDPLTGVLNRRGFFDALEALQPEDLTALVLVMADIDHFKAVNDTHGHAVGDHVLCALADRLQAVAGHKAIVTRLGGDEFAAAIVDNGDGEHIRASLDRFDIVLPDGLGLTVDCSVGIAAHSATASVSETLAQADAALYRHKWQHSRAAADSNTLAYTAASH